MKSIESGWADHIESSTLFKRRAGPRNQEPIVSTCVRLTCFMFKCARLTRVCMPLHQCINLIVVDHLSSATEERLFRIITICLVVSIYLPLGCLRTKCQMSHLTKFQLQ